MVLWLLCEIMGRDEYDTYGIDVTPEMIAELLDKGLVEQHFDDGTIVVLQYDTVPRNSSEGWNE